MRAKGHLNQAYIVIATVIGFIISVFLIIKFVPNEWVKNPKAQKYIQQIREISDMTNQNNTNALKDCLDKASANERSSYVELNSTSIPQEGYPNARRWNSNVIIDIVGQKVEMVAKEVCTKLYSTK